MLFSSGVGFFQREGQLDGAVRIDPQFHTYNINDLLKGLVLQDLGGGQISTVNYDCVTNRERVPQTSEAYKRYLKKFDEQN